MFSILENLQKNMVYSTYKMDAILKLVKSLEVDNQLQKGVDNYFETHDGGSADADPPSLSLEDSTKNIPEE